MPYHEGHQGVPPQPAPVPGGGVGQYLGPSLAVAVPAALAYKGQRDANTTNREIAREQMVFQERMSSTAYQRSIADMKAAGLNPMLAYQQGGASSPGGAGTRVESALGPATASAQAARRMREELKQISATTSRIKDQEWSQVQDRAESRSRVDLNERQADYSKLMARVMDLQLPALQNAARVDQSSLGRRGAYLDRIRQMILGGRGFINPVGGR